MDIFFTRVVACNETWAHQWNQETGWETLQWKHKGFPPVHRFKVQESAGKTIATVLGLEMFLAPGAYGMQLLVNTVVLHESAHIYMAQKIQEFIHLPSSPDETPSDCCSDSEIYFEKECFAVIMN
jgi:hypothetical protein